MVLRIGETPRIPTILDYLPYAMEFPLQLWSPTLHPRITQPNTTLQFVPSFDNPAQILSYFLAFLAGA
jgi:hypothetical protein